MTDIAAPGPMDRVRDPVKAYGAERLCALGLEGVGQRRYAWVKRHAPYRSRPKGQSAPIPWWPAVRLPVLECGHLTTGSRRCVECLGRDGVARILADAAGYARWVKRLEKNKRHAENKRTDAWGAADDAWEQAHA